MGMLLEMINSKVSWESQPSWMSVTKIRGVLHMVERAILCGEYSVEVDSLV